MEHYRLHCVESSTDGPHKDAVLAAVRSALERFEAVSGPVECAHCASRKIAPARMLMFPSQSNLVSEVPPRAA
jgi:hypothetical protein